MRRRVENNACEIVDAYLLRDQIVTFEYILNDLAECIKNSRFPTKILLNKISDLSEYREDLLKKIGTVTTRIKNFGNNVSKLPEGVVKYIYVTGKKNTFDKIDQLNKGLDKKQTKADLYVEYDNDNVIGWSCKQSINATKSNYSVHKMLSKSESDQLNFYKKEVLNLNGFPKFIKSDRANVNKLFYPNTNNKYFEELKKSIQNNNCTIKTILVNSLYCASLPYNLYEFDGDSIAEINVDIQKNVNLEEHRDYYYTKEGKLRDAAKLFYKLSVGDKTYRVELRWKGCIHNSSPQFMIHDS